MQKTFILFVIAIFGIQPTLAQWENCPEEAQYEGVRASSSYRTVELSEYGLEVDIPSNYRTLKFQNGATGIVHPQDYALLQCIAQGRGYGRGFYSEQIFWLDKNPSNNLLEQAKSYYQSNGVEVVSISLLYCCKISIR